MKSQLASLAAVAAVSLAAAACSSSSSTTAAKASGTTRPATVTGRETLSAAVTGKAAAANLNSNSNAPLSFPQGVWAGPVVTVLKPFVLGGGGDKPGDVTWATPAGKVTVYHAPAPGFTGSSNTPPPATWTLTGTTCRFTAVFSKGTFRYVSGTGKFTGAAGSGVYAVTAAGSAPLVKGKTACSFDNVGMVQDSGAAITFTAVSPLTVQS